MLEKILDEIIEKAKISKEELMKRIKEKQKELQLISFEGAAYLVAKDLGLDFLEYRPVQLEMKNLMSGMKNVNIKGKIFKISPLIKFEKNGKCGKVASLLISDSTDYVRITLWNEQTEIIENKILKIGDTVKIVSGIVKENIYGEKEISLGKFGRIFLDEEPLDISVEELQEKFFLHKRIDIANIKEGNFEVLAKIVHLFKGKFVFAVCPICNSVVKEIEGKTICNEHDEISAEYYLVIPCIIDDGTSNMRAVFFREIAEKICEIKANELKNFDLEKRYELISEKLLGKEFLFCGKVKKNKIFDRIEMIVNDIKEIDYLKESEKMISELESF